VHVAGLESLGTNVSVPISFHLANQEEHFDNDANNTSDIPTSTSNIKGTIL
jgi:hypothetical protein